MKTFAAVPLVAGAVLAPAAEASTVDKLCTRPVILLHGTENDSRGTWRELTAELRKDGHCAHAPDYGNRAKNPITQSAKEISAYIDRVPAETGSSTVDIVGYSQGGVLARHYLKFLGGTAK